MSAVDVDPVRIRVFWGGRVPGFTLGKPVEVLSFLQGQNGLGVYLEDVGAACFGRSLAAPDGAAVGRLMDLPGTAIPENWTRPWTRRLDRQAAA